LRGFDSQNKLFEVGIYPMDADETVAFAVIDFDKSTWRRDSLAVAQKVREVGLPVTIERSRSGNGAHIFGGSPVAINMIARRKVNTLFLATPASWKGRLTQYAGRLHRLHDGMIVFRRVSDVFAEMGLMLHWQICSCGRL
jgi:hypothetical protein